MSGDAALDALFIEGFPRGPVEELCSTVQSAVEMALASGQPVDALPLAIQMAEHAVGQVQSQRKKLAVLPELACKAGCQSCCYLRVEISPAEAERLLGRVQELGLLEKVRAVAERVGGLDKWERLREHVPCALLSESGTCLAHELRPFACRAANSLDRTACERNVVSADVLGAIPIDPVPFALQRAAALGFRAACEAIGLSSELEEFHVALMRCAEGLEQERTAASASRNTPRSPNDD